MLVCISIGIAATSGFHLLVKERNDDVGEEGEKSADNNEKKDIKLEEMVLGMEVESHREVKLSSIMCILCMKCKNLKVKSIMWWLKLPSLYLVAVVSTNQNKNSKKNCQMTIKSDNITSNLIR